MGIFVIVGLALAGPASAQERPVKADRWQAWRALVGVWEGTSEGKPGRGKIRLEVCFVLSERYLKVAGKADYANTKGGEHHEDFGYVSYDSGRKTHVFRQFHIEGFVNQYTLTRGGKPGEPIELTSESCENTPPGWRARERYTLKGDSLEHTFELAAPNKPFELYARATLVRAPK
jgi:hypothetical protein